MPNEHWGNCRARFSASSVPGQFARIVAEVILPWTIRSKITSLQVTLKPRSSALMITNIRYASMGGRSLRFRAWFDPQDLGVAESLLQAFAYSRSRGPPKFLARCAAVKLQPAL